MENEGHLHQYASISNNRHIKWETNSTVQCIGYQNTLLSKELAGNPPNALYTTIIEDIHNSTESRHLSFNARSNRHQVEKELSHNLNLASNLFMLLSPRFCAMTLDSNLNPLRIPETHYLTVLDVK